MATQTLEVLQFHYPMGKETQIKSGDLKTSLETQNPTEGHGVMESLSQLQTQDQNEDS